MSKIASVKIRQRLALAAIASFFFLAKIAKQFDKSLFITKSAST
jgi:hypothetical protein